MNINLGIISTEPSLLGVDLPNNGGTISESPSVSTFLPEEDASICPLLSTTPSPPLAFSHPLTPNADDNCSDNSGIIQDTKAETSSSGSSSGIAMDLNDNTTSTIFNKNAYHHLGKNSDNGFHQESGLKQNGKLLNIPLSKDAPCFVAWNWPMIRKCTFFVFISSILAMCAIVVAMIITLPKTCNPKTAWYRGSVFYEIFPASFKDSNKNGIGDLQGITSHIDDLERLGFSAIRLNSIFSSYNYPDQYENITSLLEIDKSVGNIKHLEELAVQLHSKNMSIILDLPINMYLTELENFFQDDEEFSGIDDNDTYRMSQKMEDPIGNTMLHWLRFGIDGFYVKGIELYKDKNDKNLLKFFRNWKSLLGENRVIIVDYNLFNDMDKILAKSILQYVDLVEFYLDISNSTKNIKEQIEIIYSHSDLIRPGEKGTWIQWSLGGVSRQRLSKDRTSNTTLAATIMQLMLPGTPNIFYGDEISLAEFKDSNKEHIENKKLHHLPPMKFNDGGRFTDGRLLPWTPESNGYTMENAKFIEKMIKLRDRSPSIYKNSITKDNIQLPNTNIRSGDDIIVIERNYPRRNTFVSVSNFGKTSVQVDLSSLYYSGQILLGTGKDSGKIYFSDFEIGPMETIVIKLDK